MREKQRAFTLIELLVVISIIGILASVTVVSVNRAKEKGADAKVKADIRNLGTAMELYFDDNNAYPSAMASGCPLGWVSAVCPKALEGQFVTALPSAPSVPGVVYNYSYTSSGIIYELKSQKTATGITTVLMTCTEKGC